MANTDGVGVLIFILGLCTAFVVVYAMGGFPVLSGTPSEGDDGSGSSDTPEPSVVVQTVRADLAAVAIPYLATSSAITTCQSGGGTWRTEPSFVGCQGFSAASINCDTAIMQSAGVQCRAVQASFVCNPTNVYCYYP